MSINVKNAEAKQLIADLRRRTGKGTTDLLLELLRRESSRMDAEVEDRIRQGRDADRRFQEAFESRPLRDPRPLDQMIEYDENGLPI